MNAVVPRWSTSRVVVGELSFGPEIDSTTWSVADDFDVTVIGNLADEDVTVNVLAAGKLSIEPSDRIVASEADRNS